MGCWKQSCQHQERERVGLIVWDATSVKIRHDKDDVDNDGQWLGAGAGYVDIETGLKRSNKGRLPGIAAGASDMIAGIKRGSLKGRR
jgi:hypothetical protein